MADTKSLWIDPELHRRIKLLAAARGISMREYIESLVREEMRNAGKKTSDGQPRDSRKR